MTFTLYLNEVLILNLIKANANAFLHDRSFVINLISPHNFRISSNKFGIVPTLTSLFFTARGNRSSVSLFNADTYNLQNCDNCETGMIQWSYFLIFKFYRFPPIFTVGEPLFVEHTVIFPLVLHLWQANLAYVLDMLIDVSLLLKVFHYYILTLCTSFFYFFFFLLVLFVSTLRQYPSSSPTGRSSISGCFSTWQLLFWNYDLTRIKR